MNAKALPVAGRCSVPNITTPSQMQSPAGYYDGSDQCLLTTAAMGGAVPCSISTRKRGAAVQIMERKRDFKGLGVSAASALSVVVIVGWVLSAESFALQSSTDFCQPSPVAKAQSGPKVRIGVSQRVAPPGGVVKIRVENGSARDLGYGRGRVLQRFDGGRWVSLPSTPVLDLLIVVRAEMTSRCELVRVPRTAQAGKYRVRKVLMSVSEAHKQIPTFGYFSVH